VYFGTKIITVDNAIFHLHLNSRLVQQLKQKEDEITK